MAIKSYIQELKIRIPTVGKHPLGVKNFRLQNSHLSTLIVLVILVASPAAFALLPLPPSGKASLKY